MMKEIRARGPITAEFEPPLSFGYYKNGVFSDEHAKSLSSFENADQELLDSNSLNTRTLLNYHLQWEKLDHAISIVGWGIEDGTKYWLCKNSYDATWGESGYFKIRRGADDYGIESQPTAFVPVLTTSENDSDNNEQED
jgi:cathepsin C